MERGGQLSAAVFVGAYGRLVVPVSADADAGREIGAYLRSHATIGTLIGAREAVDAIWAAYGGGRPRLMRAQRMMSVGADDLGPWTSPRLRAATAGDLDEVLVAAARLHREDMGIDPMRHDAAAFKRRVAERIQAGQTFVIFDDGDLAFKADVGARSSTGAQIEGVYTAPGHRRRGLATGAVGQLCRTLLGAVRWVTLHVNDDNASAIGLYRKVGFSGSRPFRLISVD